MEPFNNNLIGCHYELNGNLLGIISSLTFFFDCFNFGLESGAGVIAAGRPSVGSSVARWTMSVLTVRGLELSAK